MKQIIEARKKENEAAVDAAKDAAAKEAAEKAARALKAANDGLKAQHDLLRASGVDPDQHFKEKALLQKEAEGDEASEDEEIDEQDAENDEASDDDAEIDDDVEDNIDAESSDEDV